MNHSMTHADDLLPRDFRVCLLKGGCNATCSLAEARGWSDNFDLVCNDPDVDLLEASFPDVFLGTEEYPGLWIVRVDPDAEKIVAVASAAVFPGAGDANCVLGDAAEAVA